MVAYPALHAVYRNGRLELREAVNLAEGAEVNILLLEGVAMPFSIPTVPASELLKLAGIISIGGDAVKDAEALYDE